MDQSDTRNLSMPSAFLYLTLHSPSTSQLCHFSPEDEDSTILRNVGNDPQKYKAQNPEYHQQQVADVIIAIIIALSFDLTVGTYYVIYDPINLLTLFLKL
jgi:hypothetical protein